MSGTGAGTSSRTGERAGHRRDVAESRWPMAGALLAAIGLTFLLPDTFGSPVRLLLPAIEVILLIALIVGDPGKIDRRDKWIRGLSLALVTVLIVGALWATARLTDVLLNGDPIVNNAFELLKAGAVVWISNNIAFALLYWDLDSGGSAARVLDRPPRYPDFAFPQQLTPEVAPPGWRPLFLDYLYLGFTNATAFSPTDAMPLTPWTKIAMTVQSVISLVILALVIARAVNVFK